MSNPRRDGGKPSGSRKTSTTRASASRSANGPARRLRPTPRAGSGPRIMHVVLAAAGATIVAALAFWGRSTAVPAEARPAEAQPAASDGAAVFSRKCGGSCHDPNDFLGGAPDESFAASAVDRMVAGGKVRLTADERAKVITALTKR